MTSSTFAPDSPDWTSPNTGGAVYTDFQQVNPGAQAVFILTGVSSFVINLATANDNLNLQCQLGFFPPGAPGFLLAGFDLVVIGNASGALNVSMEVPAYGAQLIIDNNAPTLPINIAIVTSNRSVAAPRFLTLFSEGSPFIQSGAFVAGTKQVLTFFGGANNGFLSNGEITAVVTSSDAGMLYFRRVDLFGDIVDIPIGAVVVGADQVFTTPLPQAGGSIVFKPTTSNAGGTISALVYGP